MNYVIETENLSVSIGGAAILNNISLNVRAGEIYGFLGANGAGKTTLMKALYQIIHPSSGQIRLFGEEIKNGGNPVYAKTGCIIETPVFFENITARKNLELHCDYIGCSYENINASLERLGLADTNEKAVRAFSLGMRQRLALARALLAGPELLILDEPINGLDPQGIIDIRTLLLELNQKEGTTIFISSHLLDELSKIATRVAVIDKGSILTETDVTELKQKNVDLETYYLNLLKGAKQS